MQRRVLVVEDDADIAALVTLHLGDAGYQTSHYANGNQALEALRRQPPDLVVLDLMLPGLGGLDLCRLLRAEPNYIPVIMLTAKSSEIDRVLGLELGADDYIAKPFSVPELVARVKALFRRIDALHSEAGQEMTRLRCDSLEIDRERRQVLLNGKPVQLTTREFDLLWEFARHPGRVYTRAQLLDSVWGYGHAGYEHTVNSHINRLRAKIEPDAANPHYVLTVWGTGYKFRDDRRV
ncbi:MAG: response regulator transcription factor [Gammaproteobacteria bacterium]|jgi:DNA-binding response OmpR family regulator